MKINFRYMTTDTFNPEVERFQCSIEYPRRSLILRTPVNEVVDCEVLYNTRTQQWFARSTLTSAWFNEILPELKRQEHKLLEAIK